MVHSDLLSVDDEVSHSFKLLIVLLIHICFLVKSRLIKSLFS